MAAFGWGREDREWVLELAKNGNDPISSLGYDGPLAALSKERQNISDYFKEAVAVVTNPAIDREREMEHFSTQTVLGVRPPLLPNELENATTFTLDAPILLDDAAYSPFDSTLLKKISNESGCATLDQLTQGFDKNQATRLQTLTLSGETTMQALERIAQTAIEAVRNGAQLLVLDDADSFRDENGWVDPILVLGVVDR